MSFRSKNQMDRQQLLCTFCTLETLDSKIKLIGSLPNLTRDSIYILRERPPLDTLERNDDVAILDPTTQLYCTYNVNPSISTETGPLYRLDDTILLHRKKAFNTLYTINALNMLILLLTNAKNGIVDKKFIIPWNEYQNTILLSTSSELKQIPTILYKIVRISDLKNENLTY